MKHTLKNPQGQGLTEYIVIIAVVLVALMAFWPKIKTALNTRVTETVTDIGQAGR